MEKKENVISLLEIIEKMNDDERFRLMRRCYEKHSGKTANSFLSTTTYIFCFYPICRN